MEIAVGIDLDGLFAFDEGEIGFRGLAGLEEAEGSAFVGEEVDPFDEVLREHRMGDRTDGDVEDVALLLDDGDVFFDRSVIHQSDEFLHRLAAARRLAADFVEFGDDGPAREAFVELDHDISPYGCLYCKTKKGAEKGRRVRTRGCRNTLFNFKKV